MKASCKSGKYGTTLLVYLSIYFVYFTINPILCIIFIIIPYIYFKVYDKQKENRAKLLYRKNTIILKETRFNFPSYQEIDL